MTEEVQTKKADKVAIDGIREAENILQGKLLDLRESLVGTDGPAALGGHDQFIALAFESAEIAIKSAVQHVVDATA